MKEANLRCKQKLLHAIIYRATQLIVTGFINLHMGHYEILMAFSFNSRLNFNGQSLSMLFVLCT